MTTLITYLQQALSAIGPFVLLLGLLVFVHELGHFLVAKYFGVRVETFSLGFGKKLFEFKRGDTVYCISIIPLGGYVKMFGDEPNAEVSAADKPYSFTHKALYQRFLVVLAGPAMNFFFAIFIFTIMALVGEQMITPQLGDIEQSTAAYRFGFRSGDKITEINNKPVKTWEDVQNVIELSPSEEVSFKVVREFAKQELLVKATPILNRNKNVISHRTWVGDIEGLSTTSRAPTIAIFDQDSAAARAGLSTGDTIISVNGTAVSTWRSFAQLIQDSSSERTGPSVTLVVRSLEKNNEPGPEKTVTVVWPESPTQVEPALEMLGIDSPELYLNEILPDSPAQKAGLQPKDHVLAINGNKLERWDDVVKIVKGFDPSMKDLKFQIRRGNETLDFAIVPQMTKHMTLQGREEERFTIGIVPTIYGAPMQTLIQRASNPIAALGRGLELTWNWTQFTVMGFVRLIQKEVSPKSIGGVISIGQVASRSFEVGLAAFLSVMGIISVNLCIVNLLPVPVLDGGHLLFYTVEALRGRPLSLRKLEILQQVGLVLLFSLMAFALFNDFSRLLKIPW